MFIYLCEFRHTNLYIGVPLDMVQSFCFLNGFRDLIEILSLYFWIGGGKRFNEAISLMDREVMDAFLPNFHDLKGAPM